METSRLATVMLYKYIVAKDEKELNNSLIHKCEFVRTANNVTLACNLKCRLCIAHSPYFIKPWHPTLEYVNKVTDRLFELGNYQIFEFTGGEPLMRNDLHEVVNHAFQYKDCVSREFRLITNGSIMPSDNLVEVISLFGSKFYVIVDDYGNETSVNAQKAYDKFTQGGVRGELRKQNKDYTLFGGWIDFNIEYERKWNKEESEALFMRCGLSRKEHLCCTTTRGIITPCTVQLQCVYKGMPMRKDEYIDLFDDTETLVQKQKKFLGFYSLKFLSSCSYCNGMCEDSIRVLPAEQLTRNSRMELLPSMSESCR